MNIMDNNDIVKRPVGRPRKVNIEIEKIKKPMGRPRIHPIGTKVVYKCAYKYNKIQCDLCGTSISYNNMAIHKKLDKCKTLSEILYLRQMNL